MPQSVEPLTDFEQFFSPHIYPKVPPPAPPRKKSRTEKIEKDDSISLRVYSLDMIHLLIKAEHLCEDVLIEPRRWYLRFVLNQENQLFIAPASRLYEKILPESYLAAGGLEFELTDDRFILAGVSVASAAYFTNIKEIGVILRHIALDYASAIDQCRQPIPMLSTLRLYGDAPTQIESCFEVNTRAILRWAANKKFHIDLTTVAVKFKTDSGADLVASRTPPKLASLRHSKALFRCSDRQPPEAVSKRTRSDDENSEDDRMSPLMLPS